MSHDYLSTACSHGLHDRCRRTCKFCRAPCRCGCHADSRELLVRNFADALSRPWHRKDMIERIARILAIAEESSDDV
jgi:hypothetical protein